MIVWLLIVALSAAGSSDEMRDGRFSSDNRTAIVIDNIATAADCQRLGDAMRRDLGQAAHGSHCYAVRRPR